MQIVIDGSISVLDVCAANAALAALHYPAPPEMARANAFLNVLGERPSYGWFLVARQDLDSLDLNGLHSITFVDDYNPAGQFAAQSLVVSREPCCITPGLALDKNALFLVELADLRHLLIDPFLGVSISKQYNLRAPAWGGKYYPSSLKPGGATWTWRDMVADLWSQMSAQLGTSSTLPFTPNGTPEGWHFQGDSGWSALNQVLCRLGCAVRCNHQVQANQYDIIQVGAADLGTPAVIAAVTAANRLIYDADYQPIRRGRQPGSVRVYFHTQLLQYGTERSTALTSSQQWLSNNHYVVNVAGNVTGTDASTVHEIWDDLPALYNTKLVLKNSAALLARAKERAADFYRMTGTGGDRLYKVFSGIISSLQPGASLKNVIYRQEQQGLGDVEPGGLVTEILQYPYWSAEVYRDPRLAPIIDHNNAKITNRPTNTTNKRSYFGPQFPVVVPHLQIVTVTGPQVGGSGICSVLYPATVQTLDPDSLKYTTGEKVWAFEINGKKLSTERYFARLTGYTCNRPLYQVKGSCCDDGRSYGGYYIFSDDVEYDTSGKWTDDKLYVQLPGPGIYLLLVNISLVAQLKYPDTTIPDEWLGDRHLYIRLYDKTLNKPVPNSERLAILAPVVATTLTLAPDSDGDTNEVPPTQSTIVRTGGLVSLTMIYAVKKATKIFVEGSTDPNAAPPRGQWQQARNSSNSQSCNSFYYVQLSSATKFSPGQIPL